MKAGCYDTLRAPKIAVRHSDTPEFCYRTCHMDLCCAYTAHRTRREPALLAATSRDHKPTESRAQLDE